MKFHSIILYAAILIVTSSCVMKKNSGTITQGISGQITLAEGNMMPGPGKKANPRGIQRKVYIYAVATAADADGQGPLYKSIRTALIATVKSDTAGFYKCSLKPGKYSVFTEEEGQQYFSGLSNEKAELSPVEVQPGQLSLYNILVNYKAVY